MTMRLIVPGVDASGLGLGFMRETFPAFGDALFCQVLLGNSWWEEDSFDYSLRGLEIQRIGSITKTDYAATPSSTAYYRLPFYDSELYATGVEDELSIISIAKTLGTDGTVFSCEQSSDLGGIRIWCSSGGTFAPESFDSGGPAAKSSANISVSPDNGSFEFMAMSLKLGELKSYRKGATTAMATATAASAPDEIVPGGVQPYIGRRTPNTSGTGGVQILGVGIYSRVLDADEMAKSYDVLKTLVAEKGISI